MLERGRSYKTDSGRTVRVGDFMRAGGQGEAYRAELREIGEQGVLKIFKDQFNTPQSRQRLVHLVNLKLSEQSAAIQAPTEVITRPFLGHFAPFAPGESLDQKLQGSAIGLIPALQVGLALTHALTVMHGIRLAHGDLHSENLLIEKAAGDVYRLRVIDLDNFSAPGVPPPVMLGQSLYMAPEQRQALMGGTPLIPDIRSDRFSLGVLLHEILLQKHPASGFDGDAATFERTMATGKWYHDPACRDASTPNVGGYPSEILDTDLARLFRRSLSLQRDERPTAPEWTNSLLKALNHTYACPHCNGEFLCDTSRTQCLYCARTFPTLAVITPLGRTIPIRTAAEPVGRSLLGDETVSDNHAVFRRLGPDTYIESIGRNGSYSWSGSGWQRLRDRFLIPVKPGDRLRLGRCEVRIGSLS